MPLLYSSFLKRPAPGGGGGGGGDDFTLVGESTFTVATGASTETKTLPDGLAGPLAENDVVVLLRYMNGDLSSPGHDIVTAGYELEGFANSPGMTGRFEWKRLGGSPDSDIEIPQNSLHVQAGIIQVWRGTDAATAMDVALVSSGFVGSGLPNAPSITPATDGCRVFAAGYLDDDNITASITAPAGYGNLAAENTGEAGGEGTVMIASFTQETAGAVDADAFGGSGSDLNVAFAFALRPAA